MEKTTYKLSWLTQENKDGFSSCIPDTCQIQLLKKGAVGIGAAGPEGDAYGAAVALIGEERVEVSSIYVKPEFRRQGIGGKLVKALRTLMLREGRKELAVEYPYPKMREMEQFLLQNGFRQAGEGNLIYSIPIGSIRDTGFLDRRNLETEAALRSMAEISSPQQMAWLQRFGKDLPLDLDPRKIGGEPLPEASFVYLSGDKVTAFTACSRLEDGALYLGALYADKESSKVLLPLIQKTLAALAEKYGDGVLCFAAATESGKRLAERLCSGHEEKMDIQTMRTDVWTQDREELLLDENVYELGNLMPRLNGLSAALNELGIENDVLLTVKSFPAVLADVEGQEFRFTYLPAGPVEEERFVLNLTAAFELDRDNADYIGVCEEFNSASLFASALFYPQGGRIILRAAVPDLGEYLQAEYLKFFLELFKDSVRQLQALLPSGSAE